jgi:protein-tyrosine phosphatase
LGWTFITSEIAIGGIMSYSVEVHDHFSTVINTAYELAPESGDQDNGGVWHFRLNDCDDIEGQVPEINRAVELLSSGQKPCLVTCAQGRNRSAVVVAAFLIRECGYYPAETVAKIQSLRKKALTNKAFVAWLMAEP